MATTTAGFHPLARWAAFTGIALLSLRKLVSLTFPNAIPSNAWHPESWAAGLLIAAAFELVLLALLLAVPVCIYFFRLRTRNSNGRDLLIDCAAGVMLYLTALLML
uniref:Uncharacterized protein n=1 Tax=Solibacter usitatus (strain Ellin6076) TaxID=234267 RepID=Q020S0_SOLUE